MENLIDKENYRKLYSDVMKLIDASITPAYLNTLKTKLTDVYDYLGECVAEYVHEQTSGWNSYYSKSAQELKSYINKCTKISLKLSDCDKIAKYIYDFCNNYDVHVDLFFANDGSNRRCYNGDDIHKDSFEEFKKYIDFESLNNTKKNNIRSLVIKFVDDYMIRGNYSDDKMNDLMNLTVEFVGIDLNKDDMKEWLTWLKSNTTKNVSITLNSVWDGFYSEE